MAIDRPAADREQLLRSGAVAGKAGSEVDGAYRSGAMGLGALIETVPSLRAPA